MKTASDSSQPPAAGEAAHTPTPWKARRYGNQHRGEWRIDSPGWRDFASVYCGECRPSDPVAAATAAFIVRACNSHAALLALAERISKAHPGTGTFGDQARAALQLAKEGKS